MTNTGKWRWRLQVYTFPGRRQRERRSDGCMPAHCNWENLWITRISPDCSGRHSSTQCKWWALKWLTNLAATDRGKIYDFVGLSIRWLLIFLFVRFVQDKMSKVTKRIDVKLWSSTMLLYMMWIKRRDCTIVGTFWALL